MATPPEVHALIDSLAADVQVAYGAVLPGNAANAYAAQFLARALVRQGLAKGWRAPTDVLVRNAAMLRPIAIPPVRDGGSSDGDTLTETIMSTP